MAIKKNYLFKITPNNKNVIINSDVLINGYPDIKYPIPFKQTSTSGYGYVVDPSTFEFIDSSSFIEQQNPYPVRMEIETNFKNLPFYGWNGNKCDITYDVSNNIKNNAAIVYELPLFNGDTTFKMVEAEDYDIITIAPKYNGKYVQYEENYSRKEKYSAAYEIKIKVYWSDNKPHSSNPNIIWDANNSTINTYPLLITIKQKLLKTYSDNTGEPVTFNPVTLTLPINQGNDFKFLPIDDNLELSEIPACEFEITATFTDIVTQVSVMKTAKLKVNQNPYKGTKKGYVHVKFIDTKPVELWSPGINYTYTKVLDDGRRTLLDKNVNSDIYKISLDTSAIFNIDNYNYVKVFYPGVFNVPSTLTNSDDINDYITNTMENTDAVSGFFTCNNIHINHYYKDTNNIDDIVSDLDWKLFQTRFNACMNFGISCKKWEDSSISKGKAEVYYLPISDKNVSDTSIISNVSVNTSNNLKTLNILGIQNEYITPEIRTIYAKYIIDVSVYKQIYRIDSNNTTNYNILRYLAYVKAKDNLLKKVSSANDFKTADKALEINTKSSIFYGLPNYNESVLTPKIVNPSTNLVIYDNTGKTAEYIYNNVDFVDELNQQNNVTIYGDVNDLDFTEFSNDSSKRITDLSLILYNYKNIVNKEDGKNTQYKFCINNLFNKFKIEENSTAKIQAQVPRFGVYPILEGYLPIDFEYYDFTDTTPIATTDLTTIQGELENKDLCSSTELKNSINQYVYRDDNDNIVINYDNIQNAISHNGTIFTTYSENTIETENTENSLYGSSDTSVETKSTKKTKSSKKVKNSSVYGADLEAILEDTYQIKFHDIPDDISTNLRINGVKINDLPNLTLTSKVKPFIFTISLDDYTDNLSYCLDTEITNTRTGDQINAKLLLTNDDNEKHLKHYSHDGKDINSDNKSFMLIRTNPKLTGNVKLVVDEKYNLYLDTFKATSKLFDYRYRKYPISAEGNYPRDIKTVFNSLPINELYKLPENSFKAHKVYTDFNEQYETMYEYGAETNTDNLYSENMKILAPLHLGTDVPQFFTIFRYDGVFNEETYNGNIIQDNDKFLSLLKNSEIVKTYDLRTYTSIGQYLNNYKDMLTNYGQCYLQFIEQDYDVHSHAYRQGNNIWKGVSVNRGILTNQSESSYFAAKLLNDSNIKNRQELFNNFLSSGFERNHLLYPNILNIEFMFNDNTQEEYSMHRYFGLYLSENDFINYSAVISNNLTFNNIFNKYDLNGNIYEGDSIIFKNIFNTDNFKDRIFYAVTNNEVDRVKSELDIDKFLVKYVKNKPENNLTSLDANNIVFNENNKSFITIHFSQPINYGEHFKLIALNKVRDNVVYTNSAENNNDLNRSNELPYDHIVYEIIASNDDDLRYTDNNISPYVSVQKCAYSENTYFYRMSFYTQDVNYPEYSATLPEQINRIIKCIEKFDSFIEVKSHNNMSFSVISKHDEMYFQHIDKQDFNDFDFDFVNWYNITSNLYITNKDYSDSVDFMPHINIEYVNKYDQAEDNERDWLTDIPEDLDDTEETTKWRHYVEAEDPKNIKQDSLSYFNKDIKYNMFALSNQSDYFDGYYAAFSNYCFETLGWRYNNIVKFIKVNDLNNKYVLYDDIAPFIKDVKYPLAINVDGEYETLNMFNIEYGYLRNNIYDPDIYESYTNVQQIIHKDFELTNVVSPFDVNHSMICATGNILLKNNVISIYKPKAANIAIMGINNIKDIDTVVDLERYNSQETHLIIELPADTTINVDESDMRIQHGVMYQLISGKLYFNDDTFIPVNDKFIIYKEFDTEENEDRFRIITSTISTGQTTNKLLSKSDVIYRICDKQSYQTYNYNTDIPMLKTENFYIDLNDIEHSELVYPVVPLTNCNWKSNGQYLDFNNVLDTSTLNENYQFDGHFVENTYTPAEFKENQYVMNRVNDKVYVDDMATSFKECILHNYIQHPIKKLLIDNVNITPAAVYYNSNIQSLEFIFSGIKFNIKLNTKQVNTFIHLEEYNDYQAFVINDYDLTKTNELYISQVERFILFVNHKFFIDYKYEAESNIKNITQFNLQEFTEYAAFSAPYNVDFRTMTILDNDIQTHTKEINNSKLIDNIDKHNLWSSLFIQYDKPILIEENNEPQFIQSYLEGINEYNDYITFDHTKSDIGLLDNTNYEVNKTVNKINSILSESNSYIVTKADGDYSKTAYELLKEINNELNNLIYPADTSVYTTDTSVYFNKVKITNKNLKLNEDLLELRLLLDNSENKLPIITRLSDLLDTNVFKLFLTGENTYDNIIIPKVYLDDLQEFISCLIILETPREKMERYITTVNDNVDIYIIPINNDVKYIKNTTEYNPLLFQLTIPNRIKFNYGWFTPNMNNMFDFYVNDELSDILDVDLLQSNTKFRNINLLQNYTGNKVFNDNKLSTLYKNYFIIPEKSLLSSTWDSNYYRKYNTENDYDIQVGHETGIDDKSFFGSRCMIFHNEYLQLDKWQYNTANDIYTVNIVNSKFNVQHTNTRTLELDINLTAALFNHFINNDVFKENWNYFKESQYTGMKNYINHTISTYYNMNSDMDIKLYYIDKNEDENINIINEVPVDFKIYKVYEGYSTKIDFKNNIYTLKINIPKAEGMDIYPVIKIYRK